MIDVSVVIPFFNAPELCYGLIAHLEDYFERSGFSSEFIVVDDGSDESKFHQLRTQLLPFNNIRLYRNSKNKGQYASMAYGISKTNGKTVIMTDQDLSPLMGNHLNELMSKRSEYDLQYIYDEDSSYGSMFRRYSSAVWHNLIQMVVPDKKILGNPMPFRLVAGSLIELLKQENYITSIIDIELLMYSKSIRFLKIENEANSMVHNVSKYSAWKIAVVIFLSLSSILSKRSFSVALFTALVITACWLIVQSVFLVAGMLAFSAIIGTIAYITNKRHSYKQQIGRIEPWTSLVDQ